MMHVEINSSRDLYISAHCKDDALVVYQMMYQDLQLPEVECLNQAISGDNSAINTWLSIANARRRTSWCYYHAVQGNYSVLTFRRKSNARAIASIFGSKGLEAISLSINVDKHYTKTVELLNLFLLTIVTFKNDVLCKADDSTRNAVVTSMKEILKDEVFQI